MDRHSHLRLKDKLRIGAVVGCAIMGSASTAFAYQGENLAPKAKVTMEQAKAIALKERPGTITDAELERERGGSGLRYSFDIKSGTQKFEVGVDANDGKVLENKVEGPNPD